MNVLAFQDTDRDFEQFVLKLKVRSGIDLNLYKENQMKRRLTNLRDKRGFSTFVEFYNAMIKREELYNEFLDHMTINVTEFFRNPNRWEVLEKRILPELLERSRRLKFWSAACSTGEEPYSLVMTLSSFLSLPEIRVLATDIDVNAIAAAKRGIYQAQSVKDVPKQHLGKYFMVNGNDFVLSNAVKSCVQFNQQNLLADRFEEDFDLIICRNVLIYFTDDAKDNLFDKFGKSLRKGGYLFIGGTEQIFQPQKYGLELVETFFYRKM